MAKRLAKKVLVIGWDAADWDFIHPMLAAGEMPALEKLIESGSMGTISTLDPPLSPMLWTSISTGKRPYKHGILGFVEPADEPGKARPVMVTSRKVKAIWNILNQHGLKSHVIGWWPGHPAEPVNGVYISNQYWHIGSAKKDWKMTEGTVHPPELHQLFEEMRVHIDDLTAAHLLPFIPDLANINVKEEKGPISAAKVIAECATVHNAATYVLEHEPDWDFMGIYYNAIDLMSHNFMRYNPPRQPHISEEQFERYKDVMKGIYRLHDMMLQRVMELAGDEVTTILLSDHGFHPGSLRYTNLPKEPASPGLEHSPYGILCMSGPGFKKDHLIHGSSLLDITPTILRLFGLPVARDMDGKVLNAAFEEAPAKDMIDSWEDIPGNDAMHPPGTKVTDQNADYAVLKQLEELGYVEEATNDSEESAMKAVTENQYFLAKSYIDAGLFNQASHELQELYEKFPLKYRYSYTLARCLYKSGQYQACHQLIKQLRRQPNNNYRPMLSLLEGQVQLELGKHQEALKILKSLESQSTGLPDLPNNIGRVYLGMKKFKAAAECFKQALNIDPRSTASMQGLGVAYLHLKKYEEAADSFLNAVSLDFAMPHAHHQLGMAMYYLGQYQDATHAFKVALKQRPMLNKAREILVDIYTNHLPDPDLAAFYAAELEQNQGGTIYIVSGLPRTGTSMMMQMLVAGGMQPFTDKVRTADESNPKGYYEHEQVKKLARDRSWVPQANGKVVKVIANLLPHLPPTFKYKVILMERPLKEVLKSQHEMLVRLGKAERGVLNLTLEQRFRTELTKIEAWLSRQNNIEILRVSYLETLNNPAPMVARIKQFLAIELNEGLMKKAIDKNLHRETS